MYKNLMSNRELRRMMQQQALDAQAVLDSAVPYSEVGTDEDLHNVRIPGKYTSAYQMLEIMVVRVGMRNVLRALLDIQRGLH